MRLGQLALVSEVVLAGIVGPVVQVGNHTEGRVPTAVQGESLVQVEDTSLVEHHKEAYQEILQGPEDQHAPILLVEVGRIVAGSRKVVHQEDLGVEVPGAEVLAEGLVEGLVAGFGVEGPVLVELGEIRSEFKC